MVTLIKKCTQREIKHAQKDQKFYHRLNAESVDDVENFIRSNLARNMLISSDMNLPQRVFGWDLPTCKAKLMRRKPPVVNTNNVIDFPPKSNVKRCEVDLVIDVFFINNEVFLHTLDQTIKCPISE